MTPRPPLPPETIRPASAQTDAGDAAPPAGHPADARASEALVRRRIADAVATEGERIAHDLHDSVGGLLTAAHILSSDLAQHLAPTDADLAARVASYTADAMEQIRAVCHGLAAPGEVAAELAAVAKEADGVGNATCTATIATGAPLPRGADGRELVLLVREAIGNALRHARAHTITLSVDRAEDGLVVEVADDGIGIAPGRDGGLGRSTMEARARRLGATLSVQSTPGDGTTVRLFLPHGGEPSPSPSSHV